MRIRRLKISNFRGIRTLDWRIPKDRNFVCLVGPGDGGKSSVLDAIHLVLGDRWNPVLADTDFHGSDVASPIVIRCVVSDLPKSLGKESALGLWLSGVDDDGEVYQDPVDGTAPCVIVQVQVDETLEPMWTVERLDASDSRDLRATQRREFATFKVDERIDAHLRWTRTSALGRISGADNSTGNAMALASRAARDAIAGLEDEKLDELTTLVQAELNRVASGSFHAVRAGLDTSLSSSGGHLALYESSIPLTNYGLGSRRLAGLAVQQLAAANKAILLADEIEYGLEPHRLVRLLHSLKSDVSYSQVFVTTHSPVAVEQAATESLAVLRNDSGAASISFLPDGTGTTLRMRRSRPSSFLGRRIIVTEGRTEEGLLLALIARNDAARMIDGESVAAGEGVVIQDGEGGAEAAIRAKCLGELGYAAAIFIDNDDRSADAKVAAAEASGVVVIRWAVGNCTERQLVESLDSPGLTSLLELGVQVRNTERTVLDDLKASGLPLDISTLDVDKWIEGGSVDLADATGFISDAMCSSSWFKTLDASTALGNWLLDHMGDFTDDTIQKTTDALVDFIYPPVIAEPSNVEADE